MTVENRSLIYGCPFADGKPPCIPNCGGNWQGTRANSEALTKAVKNGKLVPNRLGCGLLAASVAHQIRQNSDNNKGGSY